MDEDGPDITGHPHDTDDTTHNSEAHPDHQVLMWPSSFMLLSLDGYSNHEFLRLKRVE